MRSGIDHLMINANDYDKALRFYGWLMPKIGYPHSRTFNEPAPMTGYHGDNGSLWVVSSDQAFRNDTFDKGRVGLREIAFRAESRRQVDDLARDISSNGGRIRRANTIIDPATTRFFYRSRWPQARSCALPRMSSPSAAWLHSYNRLRFRRFRLRYSSQLRR
jgi:catechol 2,3-dioxygenase-like lactoylglutathione lyase family enzyme